MYTMVISAKHGYNAFFLLVIWVSKEGLVNGLYNYISRNAHFLEVDDWLLWLLRTIAFILITELFLPINGSLSLALEAIKSQLSSPTDF